MSTHAPSKLSFLDVAKGFAPGWFASVMGTGVLALATLSFSKHWEFLKYLALFLHWFNIALFIVLSIPWITRWVCCRTLALATLNHPIQANFYPTFSIALLVLATQGLAFGSNLLLTEVVWWVGALLTYVFSISILYRIFINEHVALEHVTPAQFIPAVGLIVIPIAGVPLLSHMSGVAQDLALLMNVLGLGAGGLMYFGLFALMIFRSYLHKPALGPLTPTIWVHLAPIGILPVGVLNLMTYLSLPSALEIAKVFAMLFWGAGFWWLIMVILITITAFKRGMLPFALSWWAFIFPLGALTNLSLRLTQEMHFNMFYIGALLVWVLMLSLWIINLFFTLKNVINGSVFTPHP